MKTQRQAIKEALDALVNGAKVFEAIQILEEALAHPEEKQKPIARLLQRETND